jgi:mono/diheme cytochrome c family protein
MRAPVHVLTRAAFQAWLASQPANAAPPVGTPPPLAAQPGIPGAGAAPAPSSSSSASAATTAAVGKTVFSSAGCSACHTLAAAGATGTIGPDLDQRLRSDCSLPASKSIRGATLQQCIETAITKPYAYIPSGYQAGIMPPNFATTLSSTQIQALVNFLSTMAK